MRKNKMPVRFTGQHFTINKVLITDAIKFAQIRRNDIVLDIGAGKGFLTVHLARQCKYVIAIENDKLLLDILRKKFTKTANVKVIDSDFRNYRIPNRDFKIVSNIPYRLTSECLKILMVHNMERFMGGSLIMQWESAKKLFSGKIHNPYIIFYHTFFDLKLMYEIEPESFLPPPTVRSALLKIVKRESANIHADMKEKYLGFLFFMMRLPDLPTRTVLKKVFRKRQVREISDKYRVNLNNQVVDLSPTQWKNCFLEMLEKVPEKFHPV